MQVNCVERKHPALDWRTLWPDALGCSLSVYSRDGKAQMRTNESGRQLCAVHQVRCLPNHCQVSGSRALPLNLQIYKAVVKSACLRLVWYNAADAQRQAEIAKPDRFNSRWNDKLRRRYALDICALLRSGRFRACYTQLHAGKLICGLWSLEQRMRGKLEGGRSLACTAVPTPCIKRTATAGAFDVQNWEAFTGSALGSFVDHAPACQSAFCKMYTAGHHYTPQANTPTWRQRQQAKQCFCSCSIVIHHCPPMIQMASCVAAPAAALPAVASCFHCRRRPSPRRRYPELPLAHRRRTRRPA